MKNDLFAFASKPDERQAAFAAAQPVKKTDIAPASAAKMHVCRVCGQRGNFGFGKGAACLWSCLEHRSIVEKAAGL